MSLNQNFGVNASDASQQSGDVDYCMFDASVPPLSGLATSAKPFFRFHDLGEFRVFRVVLATSKLEIHRCEMINYVLDFKCRHLIAPHHLAIFNLLCHPRRRPRLPMPSLQSTFLL